MSTQQRLLHPETPLWAYWLSGPIGDERLQEVPGLVGNWVEAGSSCLIFTREAGQQVRSLCRADPDLEVLAHHRLSYGQWQGAGADLLVVGSLAVVPPWSSRSPPAGVAALILDPGLVFGDGTHSTTVACLRAVQRVCRDPEVQTMIDLGTGTGILALAAAILGCRRVMAVDQNLLSARTARLNVERNGLAQRVVVVNGRAEELLLSGCDLLAANLGGRMVAALLRNDGWELPRYLILSGFMRSRAAPVEALLATRGCRILERYPAGDGWQTILAVSAAP